MQPSRKVRLLHKLAQLKMTPATHKPGMAAPKVNKVRTMVRAPATPGPRLKLPGAPPITKVAKKKKCGCMMGKKNIPKKCSCSHSNYLRKGGVDADDGGLVGADGAADGDMGGSSP